MNKLEEMKNSCKVFAAKPIIGNLVFEQIGGLNYFQYDFWAKCPLGFLRLWLNEDLSLFYARFAKEPPISLKSTTAKEAAHEALQLVKQEAQKLVDALNVEPKETDLQENNSWFYVRKTLGQVKDSLQAFTKKPQHLTDSVAANHFRDLEKAIIEVDKMGVELQKYNALSEPKEGNTVEKFISKIKKQMDADSEPKERFWIPIDNNIEILPIGEVIAKNEDGKYLEGVLQFSEKRSFVFCLNDEKGHALTNLTHYHLK